MHMDPGQANRGCSVERLAPKRRVINTEQKHQHQQNQQRHHQQWLKNAKNLPQNTKKVTKKHKKGANPPTQGGKSPKAQEKEKEKQKAKVIGRKIRDPTVYRPVKDWSTHTKEHTEKRLDKDGNEILHRFRPGTVALQSGYILTVFISISIIYPGFVRSSGCRGALVYWTGAVL